MSRRVIVMTRQDNIVTNLEKLKDDYMYCPDFQNIFIESQQDPLKQIEKYHLRKGLLFKGTRFCISKTSLWEYIVLECHKGGFSRHYREAITLDQVKEQFCWPLIKKDVLK